MKSISTKPAVVLVIICICTLLLIIAAFLQGKVSPVGMGYAFASVCVFAIVALTLIVSPSSGSRISRPLQQNEERSAAIKRARRLVLYYKVVIAIMPMVLIYGLWETRGDSLLLRCTSAMINIAITLACIAALRNQQARIKQKNEPKVPSPQ